MAHADVAAIIGTFVAMLASGGPSAAFLWPF